MAIENGKKLNVRILNKYDEYSKWNNSSLVLEAGEIAIAHSGVEVTVGQGKVKQPVLLMKVGDGVNTFANLPFMSAKAADVLEICKDNDQLTAFVQNIINGSDMASNEDFKALSDAVTKLNANASTSGSVAHSIATALAAYTTTADLTTALAGKVNVETGKSLIANTEIARLAAMSDEANKVEQSATNGNIKIDGVETVVYTHPDKHAIADVTGLQDALDGKQAAGDYATKTEAQGYANAKDASIKAAADAAQAAQETADSKTTMAEVEAKNYATKTEAQGYANAKDDAIAAAKKSGDDAQADVNELAGKVGTVPENKTIVQMIADAQSEATYDDTALAGRVKAIEDDYLKGADKTALQDQIDANASAIELLTNGVKADEVDGVNDLIQYVKDHGTEVTGMKADIAANAKAIEDQAAADAAAYETKTDAAAKLTEAKNHANGLNSAMDERVQALEGINHDAYKAADETVLASAKAHAEALTDIYATKAQGQKADTAVQPAALNDYYTKTQADAAFMDADETSDAIDAKIDALKLGTTYEPIGAEDRAKAYADGLAGNYATAEQGEKADTAIQSVTSVAGNGIKATTNGTAVSIDWDPNIVFVFDCGNSEV